MPREDNMDYLKNIFGDKSLSYAELEAALKDNKDVKLANLAAGQYIDKAKLARKAPSKSHCSATRSRTQRPSRRLSTTKKSRWTAKSCSDWTTR